MCTNALAYFGKTSSPESPLQNLTRSLRSSQQVQDSISSAVAKYLSTVDDRDLETPALKHPMAVERNPRYNVLRRSDAYRLGFKEGQAVGYNTGYEHGARAGFVIGCWVGYDAASRRNGHWA